MLNRPSALLLFCWLPLAALDLGGGLPGIGGGLGAIGPTAPMDAAATFGGDPGSGVRGWIELGPVEGTGLSFQATFIPPPPTTSAFHLYSMRLPMEGIDGIGRPTLLEAATGARSRIEGLTVDQQEKTLRIEGFDADFPVYPAGPVVLSGRLLLPEGDGTAETVELLVTYMACNDESCLRPVTRLAVPISVPTVSGGITEAAVLDAPRVTAATDTSTVSSSAGGRLPLGEWQHPQSADELDALLARIAANGQTAFLDFTGPSCLNCQIFAKQVFPLPPVAAAMERLVLIEVDTDPPHDDLSRWQLERFGTLTRPFYARITADGSEETWAEYFGPGNTELVEQYTDFLGGGEGIAASVGLWAAILGGLFTLIMPCTYPMIPFTINFFAKQQEAGRNLPLLGGLYALGIIVFFVVLGLVVAGIFGRSITDLSGHAITNLVIGLIFVTLGLSLFGVIHINLPSGLTNAVGGGRSGYIGALLMGLTFAVTAFTCTAPIAGLVLAEAATGSRSLLGAAFYLSVYGAVIGVPFFFLAMSPKLLAALPRSGGWMNEFKVVGGVVEIAAAFKFLIISDLAWGWGIFRRDPVLAAWAMLCFFAAAYLLGWFRTASDSPVQRWHHPTRLAFVLAFLALAIWFAAGLAGRNLGAWEGLFPG